MLNYHFTLPNTFITSVVRVGTFVVTQVYFGNVSYKAFYFHYCDPRKDHSGSIFFYKISATKEKQEEKYIYTMGLILKLPKILM